MKTKLYKAVVSEDQIYDGDTIEKVSVLIYPLDSGADGKTPELNNLVEIWPDIYLASDGIRCQFSLRLYGIDAPEMHPHHIKSNGTVRTEQSLDKEKGLAQKARQALIDLLKEHDWTIYISDVEIGKFAGRLVGKAFVKDENDKLRSVSNHLLMKGLVRHYFGGHKETWENWN